MCQGSSSPTSFMLAGLRMLHWAPPPPPPPPAWIEEYPSRPQCRLPRPPARFVRLALAPRVGDAGRARHRCRDRLRAGRSPTWHCSGAGSEQTSSPCAAPTPCGCKRPTSPLPPRPWWPTCPTTSRRRCAAPVRGADHAMSALLIVQPGSPTALVAYPGSCIYGMLPRQGLLRRHGHVGAFVARGVSWPVSDVESGPGVH